MSGIIIFPLSYTMIIIWIILLIYSNSLESDKKIVKNGITYPIISIEWMILEMITALFGLILSINSILGMQWIVYDGTVFTQISVADIMTPWLPLTIILFSLYMVIRTVGKRIGF